MNPLHAASWSFMLWFGCAGSAKAEDPIVVHYSDPSLTRLEKQLGITAAQRDRFDDIVVKYRDPLNDTAATSGNESVSRSSGKHERGGRSGAGIFGGGRRNISRQELDELATILTSEQIKQFKELRGKKAKGRGTGRGE